MSDHMEVSSTVYLSHYFHFYLVFLLFLWLLNIKWSQQSFECDVSAPHHWCPSAWRLELLPFDLTKGYWFSGRIAESRKQGWGWHLASPGPSSQQPGDQKTPVWFGKVETAMFASCVKCLYDVQYLQHKKGQLLWIWRKVREGVLDFFWAVVQEHLHELWHLCDHWSHFSFMKPVEKSQKIHSENATLLKTTSGSALSV